MPKKKNPDSLEELQTELEKAERKKKYYEQQEKILTRKVIPKLTRAERTNRLCTRAGMLESFLVHPELLSNDQVMDLLKIAFRQKEVDDPELQSLLEQRYLNFRTWEQIAVDMGYNVRHVYRMHDKALKKVRIPQVVT